MRQMSMSLMSGYIVLMLETLCHFLFFTLLSISTPIRLIVCIYKRKKIEYIILRISVIESGRSWMTNTEHKLRFVTVIGRQICLSNFNKTDNSEIYFVSLTLRLTVKAMRLLCDLTFFLWSPVAHGLLTTTVVARLLGKLTSWEYERMHSSYFFTFSSFDLFHKSMVINYLLHLG